MPPLVMPHGHDMLLRRRENVSSHVHMGVSKFVQLRSRTCVHPQARYPANHTVPERHRLLAHL